MFYVYHGYVSPDHHDSSDYPIYGLSEFDTEQEVLDFKKEFDENIHEDCRNVIFRIISGRELELEPVETVTTWKLS